MWNEPVPNHRNESQQGSENRVTRACRSPPLHVALPALVIKIHVVGIVFEIWIVDVGLVLLYLVLLLRIRVELVDVHGVVTKLAVVNLVV